MNTLLSIVLHSARRGEIPASKLLVILRSALNKPMSTSGKVELIFEVASLGAEKFEAIVSQLADKFNDVVLHANYDRLKLLLIHLAYICSGCFLKFIHIFKDPLSRRLLRKHFNDVMQLSIELARVNEELGVAFLREYSTVLVNLSRSEGVSHLSQIILYTAWLGYKNLAWQIFESLIDVFKCQSEDPVKLAWVLRTFSKAGDHFLERVVDRLRDFLLRVLTEFSKNDLKKFISIICRDKSVLQRIKSMIKNSFELECPVY